MKKTLGEIAEIIGGEVSGDKNTIITNVAGITEAKNGDITFISNSKYIQFIDSTKASAIIISEDQKSKVKIPAIVSKNPYLSYTNLLIIIAKEREKHPLGISKNSAISDLAVIGNNVSISDFSVFVAVKYRFLISIRYSFFDELLIDNLQYCWLPIL